MWWITVASAAPMVVEEEASEDTRASSSTTVDVENDRPASASLASALSGTSGTVIRQMGGFGDLSTVSLRGSNAQQVNIFYDSIPLNPDGSSAVNLSEISLSTLDKIQIYRSMPPPRLQSAAIGGSINLIPRHSLSYARAEVASYGWLRAQVGEQLCSSSFSLDLLSSDGDFPVYMNQGTPFTEEDDQDVRRQNNQLLQGSILVHGSTSRLKWLYTGMVRHAGQPGTENHQTLSTTLTTQRHLAGLQYGSDEGALTAWFHHREERYKDPNGELGAGSINQITSIDSAGGSGHFSFRYENLRLQTLLRARAEQISSESVFTRVVAAPATTLTLVISPNLITDLGVILHHLQTENVEDNIQAWTPQAALQWQISETVHSWASAEQRFRPPTSVELSGYSGLIKGNPDLLPERSETAEVGLQINDQQQQGQAAIFGVANTEHILYVQNAQRQAIPVNLSRSTIFGAELSGTFRHSSARSESSATWLHTTNLSDNESTYGKRLPNLPEWQLSQRSTYGNQVIELGHHWLWSSGVTWDALGWFKAPPRSTHALDLTYHLSDWSVELGVYNLLDTRTQELPMDPLQPALGSSTRAVMDYVGMPLSGRRWVASIRWSPEK